MKCICRFAQQEEVSRALNTLEDSCWNSTIRRVRYIKIEFNTDALGTLFAPCDFSLDDFGRSAFDEDSGWPMVRTLVHVRMK